MIRVRHGLMLIGSEGTGKSSVYKVLEKSMNLMHEKDPKRNKLGIQTFVINPKAMTYA
jgi:DNA polymerase III gamma/tau subunit